MCREVHGKHAQTVFDTTHSQAAEGEVIEVSDCGDDGGDDELTHEFLDEFESGELDDSDQAPSQEDAEDFVCVACQGSGWLLHDAVPCTLYAKRMLEARLRMTLIHLPVWNLLLQMWTGRAQTWTFRRGRQLRRQ